MRSFRLLLTHAVGRPDFGPKTVLQADLATAFLQAENRSDLVFLKLPGNRAFHVEGVTDRMFSRDGYARAVKTLYGTMDAPANLDYKVHKDLISIGFCEMATVRSVFVRFTKGDTPYAQLAEEQQRDVKAAIANGQMKEKAVRLDGWVYVYVDDSGTGPGVSTAQQIAEEIKVKLKWKFKNNEHQELGRFVGNTHVVTSNGIHISQEYLAASMPVELNPGETFGRKGPFTAGYQEKMEAAIKGETERGEFLGTHLHGRYRTILGTMSYLQSTRPDLLFAIHFCARFMSAPTRSAMTVLLLCARYMPRQRAGWALS